MIGGFLWVLKVHGWKTVWKKMDVKLCVLLFPSPYFTSFWKLMQCCLEVKTSRYPWCGLHHPQSNNDHDPCGEAWGRVESSSWDYWTLSSSNILFLLILWTHWRCMETWHHKHNHKSSYKSWHCGNNVILVSEECFCLFVYVCLFSVPEMGRGMRMNKVKIIEPLRWTKKVRGFDVWIALCRDEIGW